jgi:hypothetical protein
VLALTRGPRRARCVVPDTPNARSCSSSPPTARPAESGVLQTGLFPSGDKAISSIPCHANHSTASPRLGGGTSRRSGRGLRLAESGTTFPVRSVSAVVQQASNFLRARLRLGAGLWQAQTETGASPTSRDITPIPLPFSSSCGPSEIRTRSPRSPTVSMVGCTSTSLRPWHGRMRARSSPVPTSETQCSSSTGARCPHMLALTSASPQASVWIIALPLRPHTQPSTFLGGLPNTYFPDRLLWHFQDHLAPVGPCRSQ